MKNISLQKSRLETLSRNRLKGKIAEEIAKEDYVEHGYKIINTGIGSDFRAIKVVNEYETYEEYVDVKAGNAVLSHKQLSTKRMLKRLGKRYFVYRISNEYLEYKLKETESSNFQHVIIVKDYAISL